MQLFNRCNDIDFSTVMHTSQASDQSSCSICCFIKSSIPSILSRRFPSTNPFWGRRKRAETWAIAAKGTIVLCSTFVHLVQILSVFESVWRVDGSIAYSETLEVDLEVCRLVLVVDFLANGRHIFTLDTNRKVNKEFPRVVTFELPAYDSPKAKKSFSLYSSNTVNHWVRNS